jgi:5-methylcytosine-specific restriction endonuclease McrBC GTP-binding regulatory subunit McrB
MQAIAKAISNLNEDLENPSPVFLLIDEINRGDCSSIFGDIFQLLDRDEKGNSQYGVFIKPEIKEWLESEEETGTWDFMGNGDLNIPHNLSIIGTMNTSDQNLYPMDTAFKRRWEWQSCSVEKEYETFQEYCQDPYLEIDGVKYDWIKLIKKLNDHITNQHNMEDKQIGPWFIRPNNDGSIDQASFANKLLFYLWHDVFKDEQGSQSSPFLDGDQISTFGKLQDTFETGGLEAIFKKEVLPDGLGSSPESAGESNPIRSDDLSEEPESPGE